MILDRLPRGQAWRFVTLSLVVIGVLILAFAVLDLLLPDTSRAKDLAGVVQAGITFVAIIVGGVVAFLKLQVFRDFEPHLTISNWISHRLVGTKYVHIAVTAVLHNSSKVKVEIRRGFFRLQQLAPVSDEEVERLYDQVFVDEAYDYIQWPALYEIPRTWSKGEILVEPGESHHESCEFIVTTDVESVIIYTYFYNSGYAQASSETSEGWGVTSVYDILNPD